MKESSDWLDRAMSAVLTFLGAGLALVFALALTETYTSVSFSVGGSRSAVGWAIFAISLALAIWRGRSANPGKPAPTGKPGVGGSNNGSDPFMDKVIAVVGKPNGQFSAEQLSTWFQAEAKEKDDAHKAQIRAHVERPVPPTSDADRAATAMAREACLAIRHVFPPRHPQRSMSFFGGTPLAPPGEELDYPMIHNREGLLEPLTFMGQIDLSALPDGPARSLLPDIGYLYFFAPMSRAFDRSAMHFCVRYVPRKVGKDWGPLGDMLRTSIDEPANLPYLFPWLNWLEKPGYPRAFPRVEIELGWIDDTREVEEGDPDAANGFPWDVAAQRIRAQLVAFHGVPAVYDPVLSWRSRPVDRLWVPYEGFPSNRHAVDILTGFLKSYIKKEKAAQRAREASQPSDAAAAIDAYATFEHCHRDLLDLRGRALDDQVRAAVLAMLDEVRSGLPESLTDRNHILQRLPHVLNKWISVAAIESVEAALREPGGAAQIPAEIIEALRYRHTPLKEPFSEKGDYSQHQMLGRGELVQTAAGEMGEEEGYILLLQLVPDDALGWSFGDAGVLQYWIHPADLAARRFENSILTIESH